MNTYYFTFGQVHCDPDTGEMLRDYWMEIQAENSTVAVDYMIGRFGYKWAGMYAPKSFNRVFYPAGRYGDVVILETPKISSK